MNRSISSSSSIVREKTPGHETVMTDLFYHSFSGMYTDLLTQVQAE